MESIRPTLVPAVSPRGFTLAELVVVVGIMIVITAITITGQGAYNRSLLLTDTAYTIAMSLREAQSYGLSTRKFSTTQNAGYGLQISGTTDITTYRLYADAYPTVASGATPDAKPGNNRYDAAQAGSELLRTYTLNRGFTIREYCGTTSADVKLCSNVLSSIDIVFRRPNIETTITATRTTGATVPLKCATIKVTSPDKQTDRCIAVSSMGQISVLQSCPLANVQTCP